MNNKSNARKAAYEAKQEKQAKKVVNGIFIALVVLAIAYAVYETIILG